MIDKNENLIETLKNAPNGRVDFKNQYFFYDPKKAYELDALGIKHETDYVCSGVIAIIKYNIGKFSLTSVRLGQKYKGKAINTSENSDEDWDIETYSFAELKNKFNFTTDWKEFKTR